MEYRHASFFSGIGGFDLGFERAGFRTVSHSEVKPYACAILETHWPGVPNLGDLNALCPDGEGDHDCPIPAADVWSGGFPCSDFSTMGKRAGLANGLRSTLGLVFLDLVRRHRPAYVVLENVPGLLTSHAGQDLALLLSTLGDLGYGWAFRLLDARNFGLPQARRRVFIVAAPSPERAGAVLDDTTDRRVAPAEGVGLGGDSAGGGGAGSDLRARYVLAPTYNPAADRWLRSDGAAYPILPSNRLYVTDDVEVVAFDPYERSDMGRRHIGEAPPIRPANRIVVARPGDPVVWGDGGGVGGDGGGDGGGVDWTALAAGGSRPADRGRTSGPHVGPPADADGGGAAAGLPGPVDDTLGGGSSEVGPKHLDLARWHVIGRAVPVAFTEWIGLGLRTVMEW